jgi:hypothetical protein
VVVVAVVVAEVELTRNTPAVAAVVGVRTRVCDRSGHHA